MSTTVGNIDLSRYGRLLARTVPRVIKTEEENERALAIVESLMSKGEQNLSPEEDALLELLAGLTAKELWPVVGSKSRVSEILAGKRGIGKEQAKRLAEFFHLDVGLFL